MTTNYPWNFEPCSTEGALDPHNIPWQHACRGRKPQRPVVMGYGNTPQAAEDHAVREAHQQDAREVLGARREVKTKCHNDIGVATLESQACPEPIIIEYIPDDAMIAFTEYRYRGYGWWTIEPTTKAISLIVNISV